MEKWEDFTKFQGFHGNFHENYAGDRDGLMGIDGVPMGG